MARDVVQEVKKWTTNKRLDRRAKSAILKKAKKYQHGDDMAPEEEREIVGILDEMEKSGSE